MRNRHEFIGVGRLSFANCFLPRYGVTEYLAFGLLIFSRSTPTESFPGGLFRLYDITHQYIVLEVGSVESILERFSEPRLLADQLFVD
ncbi:hypothetical protein EYC84_005227 [Monilinia fructicola]|uniref:Uncharacterized protein n=1 Tax=Monilinia fructicola TaxID=38448 RepID=A0A5M9JVU0_MONFR|nr:hypothetical protein EYC84_005227 [Monilinia fructicola]